MGRLPSTLIMPSPAAQVFSMFQSILLSLGQSINNNNALYISNYNINNTILYQHGHGVILNNNIHTTLSLPWRTI